MVTLGGTISDAPVEMPGVPDRKISNPPAGAGLFTVMVTTEEPPLTAEVGLNVNPASFRGVAVTVSTLVTGTWPCVLALIVTSVVSGTEFADQIVPLAVVQPGKTVGPGCSLENATEGLLLVTVI